MGSGTRGMAWGAKPAGTGEWVRKLQAQDASFRALHVMPSRKFSPGDWVPFAAALASSEHLEEFYASGHHLDSIDLNALASAISENRSLHSLCLGDAKFGDEGTITICEAIKGHASMTKLDLAKKAVGPLGALSLATTLAESPLLADACVAENPLTDDGAAGPATALTAEGCGLTALDLADIQCTVKGADAIGTALPSSKLQTLNLACNEKLGGDGVRVLVSRLLGSFTLTSLDLCGTACGDDGAEALASVLHG